MQHRRRGKPRPLKKNYIGFGNTTPKEMIQFLQDKTAIKMNSKEMETFKKNGFAKAWNTTKHIATYFKYVEEFAEKLGARSIETSTKEQTMVAVARIYNSEYFTKVVMTAWEEKAHLAKTWDEVKRCFRGNTSPGDTTPRQG